MISEKEVKHIARLARLCLTSTEEKKFQKELSAILDYFKMLEELDTSKVLPTFHPTEEFIKDKMRDDKINPCSLEIVNKLIEMAPNKKDKHIRVKAIL